MFLPDLNIQLITEEELTEDQIEFFFNIVQKYSEVIPFSSLDLDGEDVNESDVIMFQQGEYNIYVISLESSVADYGKELMHELIAEFPFDFSLDISQ